MKIKALCKLVSMSIISFFISCVPPSAKMKTSMSPFTKDGMAVGSFSIENKRLLTPRCKLKYIQIEAGRESAKFVNELNVKKTKFVYNTGFIDFGITTGDFKDGNKNVFIFNVVKTAGIYKMYAVEMYYNSGVGESTTILPIDIKFEILEGKIKYFGEVNINIKQNEAKLLNNIERDRLKFQELKPEIQF